VAVSGSYADSFAQSNPGAMYVEAIATGGTLYATGASGNAAPGSGTSSIAWSTGYNDVNAVLNSLTFAAGDTAGSGSIYFEVWNQAGVETTDTVPVTISGGTGGGSTVSWTGAANDGAWNTPSNWSNNAVPTSGDIVLISPSGVTGPSLSNATLTGETIVLGSSSQTGPSVIFNDVTLDAGTTLESAGVGGSIGDAGTLTVASGAVIAANGEPLGISSIGSGPATLVNDGTISNAGTAFMALNDVVENHGVIIDSSPDTMSVGNGGAILNTGTIVDAGGNIQLNGAVQGGTVAFTGSGGLLLLGVLNPFAQGAVVSGFGSGDRMVLGAFNPTNMSFSGGTLDLAAGSFGETIPFAGGLGLGNFELNTTVTGANGTPTTTLLYAPPGGPSGTASGEPDITAPGTATVAQGGTLALNDVSIGNAATGALNITSTSGTLDMTGASGNGTDHLTVTNLSENQVNSELASLTYMPSAGASSDTIEISASSPFSVTGTTDTIRYIPVSITGGNGSPSLNEQSAETVAPNSTTAIGGSYLDSFAQGNAGDLYLGISDSSGTLTATDASGNAVAGSGTNAISLSTDYVDLNAILSSLHYTAGSNLGIDTVRFDVWNQAGVETVGTTNVTIGQISGGAMTAADFSPASSGSALSPDASSSSSGSYLMGDADNQPVGMPIVLHPAS
jgi:fibronectin-binding autotransporter adhesin